MNIDILIRTYNLALKDLSKTASDKSNPKNEENKQTNEFTYNKKIDILSWIFFSLAAISVIGYLLFLFINKIKYSLYCFSAEVILCIIIIIIGNSDEKIRKRLFNDTSYTDKRMRCLVSILSQNYVALSNERIDELIDAAQDNKSKYNLWITSKKFSNIVITGTSLCGSVIAFLLENIIEIGPVSATISVIFTLAFWFSIFLVFFVVIRWVYETEIDPLIRKMYYFHDSFIYDLNQLKTFKEYYSSVEEEIIKATETSLETNDTCTPNTVIITTESITENDNTTNNTDKKTNKDKSKKKKKKS